MFGEKIIKVGITAPVHNRRDLTLLCLRSLSRLNTNNLEVQIVIVDDGSTDGTSEAIEKEFPGVEIVRADGSLWFTEGTNVGIRTLLKKNPDYILMINDDQVFDADALRYMVETAEKYPRSIIGSLLLLWDMPHKIFQVAPQWKTFKGGWQHAQNQTVWTIPKKPWQVDIIVGNCVLVPVEAIHEVGLMNSRRYQNFGDAEYTPRLKKNGWQLLIEPRARVFCQPNTVPQSILKMSFREKMNALFFNAGHVRNVPRLFKSYLDGAPNKMLGAIGFGMYFVLAAGQKIFGKKENKETAFSDVFSNSIVKE